MLITHESYPDSAIVAFKSLRGKPSLESEQLFIAEGRIVVEAILTTPLPIRAAFLTQAHFAIYAEALASRPEPIDVFIADKQAMENIVGYKLHQGLMMTVRIPPPLPLDLLIRELKVNGLAIALDGISDAENMGAIIRNCAAFGISTILLDDQSCSPYLRRAVRVSMGTIARVNFCFVTNLPDALQQLRANGAFVVGAALGDGTIPLHSLKEARPTVAVFGSEGFGLRNQTKGACDILAEIPMSNGVDSLNVAIASGIMLYELSRGK